MIKKFAGACVFMISMSFGIELINGSTTSGDIASNLPNNVVTQGYLSPISFGGSDSGLSSQASSISGVDATSGSNGGMAGGLLLEGGDRTNGQGFGGTVTINGGAGYTTGKVVIQTQGGSTVGNIDIFTGNGGSGGDINLRSGSVGDINITVGDSSKKVKISGNIETNATISGNGIFSSKGLTVNAGGLYVNDGGIGVGGLDSASRAYMTSSASYNNTLRIDKSGSGLSTYNINMGDSFGIRGSTAGFFIDGKYSSSWHGSYLSIQRIGGFLGILKDTASTALDVNGTVSSSALQVNGSATIYQTTATPLKTYANNGYSGIEVIGNGGGDNLSLYGYTAGTGTAIYSYNGARNAYTPMVIKGSNISVTSGGEVSANTLIMTGLPAANETALYVSSTGVVSKATSSRRYKTNIGALDVDSSKIYQIQPKSWNYRAYESRQVLEEIDGVVVTRDAIVEVVGQRNVGAIAEEVDEVLPELVNYDTDGQPESIRESQFVWLLLEEVKKLKARIEALENP